ncbi:MAG: GtrA family protein [Rhodanobacter sp.]
MKIPREIVLFAVGGVIGLVIDAGVVQALVGIEGWNPYLARVVSFLLAASVTWWWNRRHTFAERSSGRSAHAEWLHWMGLMGIGAVINYGVFAALLMTFASLHQWPAIPTAAGSAVAATVNFAMARWVLFKGAKMTI